MSFNIRNQNDSDKGVDSWDSRKEKTASVLRFHNVDIVGLQEVFKGQLEYLCSELKDYDYIGVGRDDGREKGEYIPILYRRERLNLLDWGVFWLSETPDIRGSKGWDAVCIRITTWGRFKDKATDREFYFFNTHFDHRGQVAMEQSSHLLLNKIEKIAGNMPSLTVGDFNNTPDSKVYDILTNTEEMGIKDARNISRHGHHGCNFSFHGFRGLDLFKELEGDPEAQRQRLIDYIFVKNKVDVINHGILPDNWNGEFPSDHLPIVADIIL
ncbi:MAG: endonuclease/exonuclease/phosphatase family protein [Clostridiales bacterium]|nr:endonuclease/exonuclease/phosphatase family protein [Clostridiales bacterium]